jgi:hypothetical protein
MTKILSTTTEFETVVDVRELKKFLGIPDEIEFFSVHPIKPFQSGALVYINGPKIVITYKIVTK